MRPNNNLVSILDQEKTGRGELAQKATEKGAIADLDKYTGLTFPITANSAVRLYMEFQYVPLVKHPGIAVIVKRQSINDIVYGIIVDMLKIWPLLFLNNLFMILVGFTVWLLVSTLNLFTFFHLS
jgi:hypothetical protein